MKKKIIFIPGIMGSVLELDGEIIWPGSPKERFFRYNRMEQLLRDDLEATDCIRRYYFLDQYQKIINDLENCGYSEKEETLIIAAYDWRKSNSFSAEVIGKHIERIVYGYENDIEIIIVAHSMGGLIARYYLESGHFNDRTGFKNVKMLITIATPHKGASIALPLILGYQKRLFLNKNQVLTISSDPRFPSAYQLLPPKTEAFAWDGLPDNNYSKIDVYDHVTSERLGLNRENLNSALQFHEALNIEKKPNKVRYFCFTGTKLETVSHVLIFPDRENKLKIDEINLQNGGDGTVPTWSGFTANSQRFFIGGDHATIFRDYNFRRTIGVLLGKETYLAGIPQETEVILKEKVVEPDNIVHVFVSLGSGIKDFSGVLTIERAKLNKDTGFVEGFYAPVKALPIEYKGILLENISLVISAPSTIGVYRVSIRNELKSDPAGYDELVVQEV